MKMVNRTFSLVMVLVAPFHQPAAVMYQRHIVGNRVALDPDEIYDSFCYGVENPCARGTIIKSDFMVVVIC